MEKPTRLRPLILNTGSGVYEGAEFNLGRKVAWRLDGPEGFPRYGETLANKNRVELISIVIGAQYLEVHIIQTKQLRFQPASVAQTLAQKVKVIALDGAIGS